MIVPIWVGASADDSGTGGGPVTGRGIAVPVCPPNARQNSPTEGKRSSRSLLSARRMAASACSGTSGARVRSGTGSDSTTW